MLEEYIKETVKNELAKQKLNGMYGKNKQDLKYEIDSLKQENEKLKRENKQLKNLSCTIVVGNDGKLDSLFNQKLKSENEKLKKELLDSKNGLNGANDIIKNMKQEKEKLKTILNEIHEICYPTWGVQLPYFEVRRLLNIICEISINGLNGKKDDIKNANQENEKLKKENEILQRSYNFINDNTVPDLESKLRFKERIATEINSRLNKEKQKVEDLKQENEKLKIKVDEYYNKFLSEGIKKEKAQRKLREIKKEIDSQGFDHEGFYNLQNMYHRIENILKES